MIAAALLLWLSCGAGAAPAKVATEDVDALLSRLSDASLAAEERKRLLKALRKTHDPAKLATLFTLAASTATPLDLAQASWGAMAETALDHPEQARALVPGWLKSDDPERRYRGLQLIKEGVWDPSFVPLIRRMLRQDADEENRAEAAETLADNDVRQAKADLKRAAKDKSKAVREAAKKALEELETPEEGG